MVTEDITNMNEAELHELNAIAKANLFQQRRKVCNVVLTAGLTLYNRSPVVSLE